MKAEYPVEDVYTLSDETEIGTSSWAVLKKDAMKIEYKSSSKYVSCTKMINFQN